ncbi:MAG: SDR family oxidoreductase [Saprospiraceae bacterium]|nr:SDR family oxidoreductase [Saprospiraceae bacterium]
MSLEGKTALITGGSKGIGLGVAEAMLAEGMSVLITGRSEETLNNVKARLEKIYPGNIAVSAGDVRNMSDMKTAVDTALNNWGQLDAIIANAGIGHFASIQDMTEKQWNDVIDINLTGVFNTIKASVDALIKSKGYFISIASLAGTNFFARGAAYNASKFGLVGFTQAVMLDLRQHGVKCSTIMPGSVATYFNDNVPDASDDWKIQPEDIGQMVVDLMKIPPRTLPSKVEVRPSMPPSKS